MAGGPFPRPGGPGGVFGGRFPPAGRGGAGGRGGGGRREGGGGGGGGGRSPPPATHWPDVHVGEEVLPHVAPVAVRAVGRHRVVLVEVERRHRREVDLPCPVPPDQLAVDPERRTARGEPEHAPALRRDLAPDRRDDALGEEGGEIVVVGDDERADALALARALDRGA